MFAPRRLPWRPEQTPRRPSRNHTPAKYVNSYRALRGHKPPCPPRARHLRGSVCRCALPTQTVLHPSGWTALPLLEYHITVARRRRVQPMPSIVPAYSRIHPRWRLAPETPSNGFRRKLCATRKWAPPKCVAFGLDPRSNSKWKGPKAAVDSPCVIPARPPFPAPPTAPQVAPLSAPHP